MKSALHKPLTSPHEIDVSPAPRLQQIDRTYVLYHGRKFSYFSGCDYFRLSNHPRVLRAFQSGVNQIGLNVAASRVTTGNHEIYGKLEKRLARFFSAERAILFSSGYMANLGTAQALAGTFSHALLDERAHASLADAATWLGCPVRRFPHRNAAVARQLVKDLGRDARPVIVTDGMFAHDGSVAPLADYLKALPKRGWLLVDDAHAAGVLGTAGKGSLEFCGAKRRQVIQTVTLSKAFGVYGGAVLVAQEMAKEITARSHIFAGNTPIPPPCAAAAIAALELLAKESDLRNKLARRVRYVKGKLVSAGFRVPDNSSPIISLTPASIGDVRALTKRLLAAGIYPPLVRYPGGPAIGYFRFALSSEHTRGQLDQLVEALRSARQALSICW